jgi:hypothetical protein
VDVKSLEIKWFSLNFICPIYAAGPDGRRNTIQGINSTMLPRMNYLLDVLGQT